MPFELGTTATIAEWDMAQLGVLQVVATGEARFRILEQRAQRDGLLARRGRAAAGGRRMRPIPPGCAPAVRLLERVIEQHAGLLRAAARARFRRLGQRAAGRAPAAAAAAKQELLELDDARARLERLNGLLRATAREAS